MARAGMSSSKAVGTANKDGCARIEENGAKEKRKCGCVGSASKRNEPFTTLSESQRHRFGSGQYHGRLNIEIYIGSSGLREMMVNGAARGAAILLRGEKPC